MGNIFGRSEKVYPLIFNKIVLKEEEYCSICLEKFDDNNVTLPCKHHYHENCIMQWFDDKSDCPLCRMKFEVIILERNPNNVTLGQD